jgi:hypothetical protein
LILRSLSDEAFGVGEGHPRRSGSLPEIIGDNLNFALLEHSDAAVSGAEVDADDWVVLIAVEGSFVL